jgi:alkylation response protein AidB-like acyl-CoA dehydrogenase
MNFHLNAEAHALQEQARETFAPLKHDRASLRKAVLQEGRFPHEMWDALVAADYFRALVPEAHGGNGAGLLGAGLCLEQAGEVAYGNGLPVLTGMVALALTAGGNAELQAEILPQIARGELKCAVGFTEEVSGFNLFRIETTATRDGDAWRLNGRKVYTSGADIADYILVVARTMSPEDLKAAGLPKTMGLSLFLVDANAAGIGREKMACRGEGGLGTFITTWDNVAVPDTHRIGEPDQAFMVLFQIVNPERILFASFILGLITHCLDTACAFARERNVFRDTPIGAYQAIQHPLADLRMRQEALRLVTYKAAWSADANEDPMETGFTANSAKYLASGLCLDAVSRAIETLGGRGFDEQYDLIHLWDMARLFQTTPISPEMILNFVAEHTLNLPRSY